MTFTHCLSTNNYGESKFIVCSEQSNGTHTTIASALSAASAGDTIFIRDGTYTENLTLKTSVNLVAYNRGNVTIVGKCSYSDTGYVICFGINFQTNSDYCISVTGTLASNLVLKNCRTIASNNTAIQLSSTSASSGIFLEYCNGNIETTGIALFTVTGAGQLNILWSEFANSGSSTTQSTFGSTGVLYYNYCYMYHPLLLTNGNFRGKYSTVENNTNSTALTTNTNGVNVQCEHCTFGSGSSSALSIGSSSTCRLSHCIVSSTNTNAITGAGTVSYGTIDFGSTSSIINATTESALVTRYGINRSSLQPAFLATLSSDMTNATGDTTEVTITFNAETFDQNSNFNTGTYTFTAPVAGRYLFFASQSSRQYTASHNYGRLEIWTTGQRFFTNVVAPAKVYETGSGANIWCCTATCIANMAASDTAYVRMVVNGGTKVVDIEATGTGINTFFGGYLIC